MVFRVSGTNRYILVDSIGVVILPSHFVFVFRLAVCLFRVIQMYSDINLYFFVAHLKFELFFFISYVHSIGIENTCFLFIRDWFWCESLNIFSLQNHYILNVNLTNKQLVTRNSKQKPKKKIPNIRIGAEIPLCAYKCIQNRTNTKKTKTKTIEIRTNQTVNI